MSTSIDVTDVSRAPGVRAPVGPTPPNTPLRVAILSSAPPTACGLATFTAALGSALQSRGFNVSIVRTLDEPDVGHIDSGNIPVTAHLIARQPESRAAAVTALNRSDVIVVQHEYGLYGGRDGSDLLGVLKGVTRPVITILHTVLAAPTRHQCDVLNEVIRRSSDVVVMSTYAETTLRRSHFIGSTAVHIIPHGARSHYDELSRAAHARPEILSWGLLGPGKGIEWAIDALHLLRDIAPLPHYVVAGRTHPKVLARQGEVYRASLVRRVQTLGLSNVVSFDDTYRDVASLEVMIHGADLILLPYDSLDQATSGVLVDAVAAGRPVIATDFPHARELLSTGAGLIVPQRNAPALAGAIHRVLSQPALAATMARAACQLAPSLSWDGVAQRFGDLATHRVVNSTRC